MKIGSKVTVTNPNRKEYGIDGEVVSIDELTQRARVDLLGCGTWGFNYSDLLIQGCANNPTQPIKIETATTISTENKKSLKQAKIKPNDKPEKRAYTKRGEKPKEIKVKRAYNKKTKTT